METAVPDVYAAGDCVVTYHRLLEPTPISRSERPHTSRAGSRARTPSAAARSFEGSLGTQVVKIFELAAARTGLRDHEAAAAGFDRAHGRDPRLRPQGLLPRRPEIAIRLTGDRRPVGSSARSLSATATREVPSASTSPRLRSTTA